MKRYPPPLPVFDSGAKLPRRGALLVEAAFSLAITVAFLSAAIIAMAHLARGQRQLMHAHWAALEGANQIARLEAIAWEDLPDVGSHELPLSMAEHPLANGRRAMVEVSDDESGLGTRRFVVVIDAGDDMPGGPSPYRLELWRYRPLQPSVEEHESDAAEETAPIVEEAER